MNRLHKLPVHIFGLNWYFGIITDDIFSELRRKYGCPIIVMNLVKRREKRPHESVLHDQFVRAISYLNQFVPPADAILYLSFDVARCNKIGSVLPKLEEIGYNAVMKQGWFQVKSIINLSSKHLFTDISTAVQAFHVQIVSIVWIELMLLNLQLVRLLSDVISVCIDSFR
jgi:hypothetical protein